jgi:hypothetical protein
MTEFLGIRRTTKAAMTNQAEVLAAWTEVRKLLKQIPGHESLADYCRLVENFRAHVIFFGCVNARGRPFEILE